MNSSAAGKLRGGFYVSPTGEFERLVADRAKAQAEEIADIVLIEPPRPFRSLARKLIDRALDVGRALLAAELLGIVPDDEDVIDTTNRGEPIALKDMWNPDATLRVLGADCP